MANVYVEARPKGRPHGDKKQGHKPLVARVRHLNSKRNPDHWRAV